MILKRRLIQWGQDVVVTFSQIMLYVTTVLFIRLMIRANRRLPENKEDVSRGILLAANHRSRMDPFVVVMHLPVSMFLQILPIRFPVHHEFMQRKRFRYILFFLGCYNIGNTPREKMLGMLRTKEYLDQKRTVFLFPEGKINRENIGDFQQGIEFFVGGGQRVVLIRIDGLERSLGALFRRGNKIFFSHIFSTQDEKRKSSALRALIEAS